MSNLEDKLLKNMEIAEKARQQFPELNAPSWQHYWFYWYLRFSKTYWLVSEIFKHKKLQKPQVALMNQIPDYYKALTTYGTFGNVWTKDFTTWWYFTAQFQFFPLVESKINPFALFNLRRDKKITDEFIAELTQTLQDLMKVAARTPTIPHMLGLVIPIKDTRRETLKAIEKYIDKTITFSPKEMPKGNYAIHKSKIRESTVADTFKVLSIRAQYDEPDLAKIAIEANVLRGAMADYKASGGDLKKMNSLDSLRAGTSRQIKQAILLSENAARGVFPSIDPIEHFPYDPKITKKLYRLSTQVTEVSKLDEKYILDFIKINRDEPADIASYFPVRY